jgi:hypothetical protein
MKIFGEGEWQDRLKELTARPMAAQLMWYLEAFHRDNPLPQTEGSYRYNA